jgi:hypothetical protein
MQRRTQIIIGSAIGIAATLGLRRWRNRVNSARAVPIRLDDPVEVASDDSFPASDPPSYSSSISTASQPVIQ